MKPGTRFGLPGDRAIRLALALVLLCLATGAATAMQDDKGQSAAASGQEKDGGPRQEIEELGATLKAAVMSGTLTEEEAGEIYRVVVERIKAERDASRGGPAGQPREAAREADEASPKRSILRLSAPKPGHVSAMFHPEFVTRDLAVLRDELDLDEDQSTIVQVLLGDYLEAIDLASSPLREALARYHRTTRDQWLATALERTDQRLGAALQRARRVDPDLAARRTREALERLASQYGERLEAADEQSRAKFETWTKRMVEVTAQLDDRLASIRERAAGELAEMNREDATITADDLVRLATRLRTEREQLRRAMTDSLEVIVTEEQRGEANARFEAALARVRIDHLLPRGRLGGESMDLWAALLETGRGLERRGARTGLLEGAESMLRARASRIAVKLDRRTEVTLDREIDGLESLAVRDRIAAANGGSLFDVEEHRLISARQPFAEAARREVTACVAVRDALRTLLDEVSAYMTELHPDTGVSDVYRQASLRRGFPMEMRRRWSERATAAALELDGLDDDTRAALLAVGTENAARLAALRADAIARCVVRDPKLARDFIDAEFGGKPRKVDWKPDMWLGINYEAFASMDDHTESRLHAILTPEEIEMLPALERAERRQGKEGRGREKR